MDRGGVEASRIPGRNDLHIRNAAEFLVEREASIIGTGDFTPSAVPLRLKGPEGFLVRVVRQSKTEGVRAGPAARTSFGSGGPRFCDAHALERTARERNCLVMTAVVQTAFPIAQDRCLLSLDHGLVFHERVSNILV